MPTDSLPGSVVWFQGILVHGVVQEDILVLTGWRIVVKLRNRQSFVTSLDLGHVAWILFVRSWGKALGLSAF